MNARTIFFFDSMLTPKFITFVYWLGLLGVLVFSFRTMFYMGFQYVTFGGFMTSLFMAIGGIIAVRIWCELMIVLFKINENIQRIANSKSPQ